MDATDSPTWADVHDLTEAHAQYLQEKAAITPAVALSAGIRSATRTADLPEHAQSWGSEALPAILFPYLAADGSTVTVQVKPDEPIWYKDEKKPRKYLRAEGSGSTLNVVRPNPSAETVLLVEGTKQTFSAASHAPSDLMVVGIAGCRAWSEDGKPIAALRVVKGKDVVVLFDADFRENPDVWAAGEKLAGVLKDEGAKSVRFVKLNAAAKTGIDDLLATKDDDEHRRDFLASIIAQADAKLPKKPTRRESRVPTVADEFFEQQEGLLVNRLSTAIRERMPAALTAERKIALYRNGYYNIDGAAFSGAVAQLLGDRFRPTHRSAAEEYTLGMLYNAGLELPTYVAHPLLNVANGMLDLPTMTLKPHDPSYMSAQQIPIVWDPDAKCPTYDRWIQICGVSDQLDDLEEATSMMLDPSRTPHKAVFLYGPSRSGKSTFLRLMQAMVGDRNMTAVTLHQLAENRFAAANIFGKMLNCAADLSSAHVEDLSIFKMMTGEDPIQADRKFGGQFAFVNKALFAFSANNPPTVGEASRAYTARIKPFKFPISFEGRENPEFEDQMIAHELPGILVRWVQAWQRRSARGTYLPSDASVVQEFETRSDRVRQFIAERGVVHETTVDGRPIGHGTTVDEHRASTKVEIAVAFNEWAKENNTSGMGRAKIVDRVMQLPGVFEVRRGAKKTRAVNITFRDDSDEHWGDDLPGGSSEARVAVLGAETATETATPELGELASVAEVAVSNPLYGFSESHVRTVITEGEKAPEGTDFLDMPHSALETATSATLATDTAAKVEQPTLLDGDALRPNGPTPPPLRLNYDLPTSLGPNTTTVGGSPFSAVVPETDQGPTCPRCRGSKRLVPPTNFFYACPACYPETFGA